MRGDLPTLNEQYKVSCEGKVTVEECQKVLKHFINKKKPSWQWNFTTLLAHYCWWYFFSDNNYSYEHGELYNMQRQAIISLLKKEREVW